MKRSAKAAAVVALACAAAGCTPVHGSAKPRAPYREDAPKSDYVCAYDGNRKCPPSNGRKA